MKSPRAQVELIGCMIGSAPSAPHSPLTCAGARPNGVNKISETPTAMAKGAGGNPPTLGRVDDGERKTTNAPKTFLRRAGEENKGRFRWRARFVEKYPVSGFVCERERASEAFSKHLLCCHKE